MTSQLSHEDVQRLMHERSASARAEIAGKLAQEIDSPRLTTGELFMAHEIVRLMAKDVEATVRTALAQSLRHAVRLPHDVAVQLASDIEAVSIPILEHSRVLTDEDLVAIVRQGSDTKQQAIAARPNVSETVSDALIDNAGEQAVTVLMKNATARIAETSMTKVIDRFAESEKVKEAMVTRPALPMIVAERLASMVSDRLRDYLVTHHDMSPTIAADLLLQSRERAIVGMASGGSDADIEKLIQQMHRNKRLTPSIILRALCMGDVAFFEASLAVMANLPLVNARILIHDGGRLGLKTLYEKTGLPMRLLPAIRVALDVVHETELDGGLHDIERYRARVIERVLTQFEDFGNEDLDYLLSKLGDMMAVA